MSHEPDCVFAQSNRPALACDYCITARAAYRRGRMDAAAAIEAMNPHGWIAPDGESDWWIDWFEAQRTARGVSERGQDTDVYERSTEECCCGWADGAPCRSCKCCNKEGEQA